MGARKRTASRLSKPRAVNQVRRPDGRHPVIQPEAESSPPPHSVAVPEHIELVLPARAEYVVIARLVAAGVAGRMLLSYDEIEDLKIAVSEVCGEAVRAGGPRMTLRFAITTDQLDIRVAHDGTPPRGRTQESELGDLLVRCLMDEVRTEREGAQTVTQMTKLRR